MGASAPIGNKNAEKWTLKSAIDLFNKAIELSKRKTEYVIGSGQHQTTIEGFEFHFIGEIATSDEIDSYSDIFKYLKSTYDECLPLYEKLKGKLEANCFSDSKKGIIKEATAIMNLKSNYSWTDRVSNDHTTGGEKINIPIIEWVKSNEPNK